MKYNISDKPYGVACYSLHFPYKRPSLWFTRKKAEKELPYWHYLTSSYYKTKGSQRDGYFDLSKKFPHLKFISFVNTDRHPEELLGTKIKLQKY